MVILHFDGRAICSQRLLIDILIRQAPFPSFGPWPDSPCREIRYPKFPIGGGLLRSHIPLVILIQSDEGCDRLFENEIMMGQGPAFQNMSSAWKLGDMSYIKQSNMDEAVTKRGFCENPSGERPFHLI
jgi:hypothetical protein